MSDEEAGFALQRARDKAVDQQLGDVGVDSRELK
jgi:hypothetical protein